MAHSLETLLRRLETRWRRIVEAPLNGTRGPLAAYQRFVQQHVEFADALTRLEHYRDATNGHLNAALSQKAEWSAPRFQSDEEEAAFGWGVVERFGGAAADQFGSSLAQHALKTLIGGNSVAVVGDHLEVRRATPEGVRMALQIYIGPLHRYLCEHLEYDALLLHHFERFALWTRWFGHTEVQAALDREQQTTRNHKEWERALKRVAAEWAFRDGMAITDISQETHSASGNMDFVLHLPGSRRVVVEAKLLGTFGTTPYLAASLSAGIDQLRTYMLDRGDPGFLLVFHNHDAELLIQTGPNLEQVPGALNTYWLTLAPSQRIGVLFARLKAPAPPSRGLAPLVVMQQDLTG